ncbi:hypothetical protein B0T20DRAFT_203628 [Sordaria brevicollis]|uniref:Uncharacterized protein n=1 Tax=Sordaria brevicollis TaxID=83679 RepID=A0AAE0UCB2_SORBR|nr:hypothetical protein B0T20DRAFT_203628 [Sordaria brevicollis]
MVPLSKVIFYVIDDTKTTICQLALFSFSIALCVNKYPRFLFLMFWFFLFLFFPRLLALGFSFFFLVPLILSCFRRFFSLKLSPVSSPVFFDVFIPILWPLCCDWYALLPYIFETSLVFSLPSLLRFHPLVFSSLFARHVAEGEFFFSFFL